MNVEGMKQLRRICAKGLHLVVLDGETEAKREAPVHGAYRSFEPGKKPIGGTLRASIHSVVFMDGQQIGVSPGEGIASVPTADERGGPGEIVGYVGTNCGYGLFVETGTVKMQGRPFVVPGLEVAAGRAAETIAAARLGGRDG